jgi:hypothetical protein
VEARAGSPAQANDADPASGRTAHESRAAEDGTLEEIRRRLAALEVQKGQAGVDADSGVQEGPSAVEASTRDHLLEHRAAIRAHLSDRADPSWAPRANRAFEADLSAAGAKVGFEVESVDCRMTTCAATIRFANYVNARNQYSRLLHMPYGIDCAREITLDPPPSDPSAAFSATVMYDCTEARSSSSEP